MNARTGELQIRKITLEPGLLPALLQILSTASLNTPDATRLAISVFVKNRIKKCYHQRAPRPSPSQLQPIPLADKESIKSNIIPLIAHEQNSAIRVQLATVWNNVVQTEVMLGEGITKGEERVGMGDGWTVEWVAEQIKAILAANAIGEVMAGVLASLELIKAFAFRIQEDVVPKIVLLLFPSIVTLATSVLGQASSQPNDTNIPTILHLLLKTYYRSLQSALTAHQQSPDSLVPWGRLLFAVVTYNVPAGVVPEDEEARQDHEWWKAKKWACRTLGRLFTRYGNPSQLPSSSQERYGPFAEHFVKEFAPEILSTYLNLLASYIKGETWLSDKVQVEVMRFLTECIKPKATWLTLKPHYLDLVSKYVHPHLSFTPQKRLEWDDDPVGLLRVQVEDYVSHPTPQSTANAFLFSLAGNRTRVCFEGILQFIEHGLSEATPAPQRYGLLRMLSTLSPWVMKHPDVAPGMPAFLARHVLSIFSQEGSEPYLRAVAVEVLGDLVKHKLELGDHLQPAIHILFRSFEDPDVVVRVHSALAIGMLKLADETELEVLSAVLSVIVDQFGKELVGSGIVRELTASLVWLFCSFLVYLAHSLSSVPILLSVSLPAVLGADLPNISELEEDNSFKVSDEEDKVYAAAGVCKTLDSVIHAVEGSPEILHQVEEVIIPVVLYTLENEIIDLYDNIYELLDALFFRLRSVSPEMWKVFEASYKAFKAGTGIAMMEEMYMALDNFLSFGSEVFKQRTDYRHLVLGYLYRLYQELRENDRVNGCKIAESVLLNLRGVADDCLQSIVLTATDLLDNEDTRILKLENLNVLINAILYNPSATLGLLESLRPGKASLFFNKWMTAIQNGSSTKGLPRLHDKNLTVAALVLVKAALKVFPDIPKAKKNREDLAQLEQEEAEEDEDIDDEVLNMNDEEEDVWDDESAYLELLTNEGNRQRERQERIDRGLPPDDGEAADDDDDDESLDFIEAKDFEEDLGFTSPLDKVDLYNTFKTALQKLEVVNPQVYQGTLAGLTAEEQVLISDIGKIADANASGANTPVPA
ncbi:ARM repeat-containing protein [Flagelloscypha sp. PMI_526]|nr:ARM repeat-containing protein [Flagelloscypha sp. PMI_526]